jgi:hypothetical protein
MEDRDAGFSRICAREHKLTIMLATSKTDTLKGRDSNERSLLQQSIPGKERILLIELISSPRSLPRPVNRYKIMSVSQLLLD